MQTDTEGNFIPDTATADAFKGLTLIRNFAEVRLESTVSEELLHDITWTLVNVPTYGSVAPMAGGTFVDDYKDYAYDTETGRMVNGSQVYEGYLFDEDPMDFTIPAEGDIATAVTDPCFVYERTHPGSDKATCILMKAKFSGDSYYTYYRLDLTDENVGGYFPLYRNYGYKVKIHKVGNRGATTPTEAMNRDSGGNVSLSTEAQKLTDISDGTSRLYVEYVEKNFTSGGKKTFWVQYVPDVTTGTVDNTKITVSIKTQGTALVEGTTLTKTAESSDTGYYFYEFELNDQDETSDLVSVVQVKAENGETGDNKSTLFRDITLRVMKKMDMVLALRPKKVETGTEKITVLDIGLPEGLPSSMFPLEIYIEDINHTLNPTQQDGSGNSLTIPVKTGKSFADGTTNSFYFIRTVNYSEYAADPTIKTEFTTVSDASATTIYVANEYFKTQSINLLNDGMYVNPTYATVAFNVTSVEVEVEFDEDSQSKTWTVTGGTGVTVSPSSGTGNGSFTMTFDVNNSATTPVTRTATVTSDGSSQTVTITQNPLEFSISPTSQTVLFSATSATVTIHAEEGKAWTASVSGTGTSLSATSGTGTATLTVTLPANTTTSQRTYTVTATMTDPSATATATIIQTRTPASPYTFNYNAFSVSNNASSASSTDGFVTVNLANVSRPTGGGGGGGNNNNNYIQMSTNNSAGTMTITPASGIKITQVVIEYTANGFAESENTAVVSTGTYTLSITTGTWVLDAASSATMNFSTTGTNGRRVRSIQVYYEAAN